MANQTLTARIQLFSKTKEEFSTDNPILLKGEMGIESDTLKFKIGDGTKDWNTLSYASGGDGDMMKAIFATNPKATQGYVDKAVLADTATTANKVSAKLTFTGGATGTYDGSAALTIAVPEAITDEELAAMTPAFTVAGERGIIATGETLSVMLGKIAKYMTDFKSLAYKDTVSESDITGTISGSKINGAVPSATKLATPRNLSLSGDVTAVAVPFDGTGNANLVTILKNSGVTAGTYTKLTVNAKGIITDAETLTANDIPSITMSKISDAGTAAKLNTGTSSGNIPVLGSNGKLDDLVIPSIAISDTFVVANQTEMLAAPAQVGDVAVRTDQNKSYILKGSDPTKLADWQELLSPTDAVQSVAGKTGVVTLVKGDVGLENVDNVKQYSATNPPPYPVTSVAGKTGAVTLNTDNVTEGSNLYYTEARANANFKTHASTELTDSSTLVRNTDTLIINGNH